MNKTTRIQHSRTSKIRTKREFLKKSVPSTPDNIPQQTWATSTQGGI